MLKSSEQYRDFLRRRKPYDERVKEMEYEDKARLSLLKTYLIIHKVICPGHILYFKSIV